DFDLFAGIGAHFAGLVDAELTSEINGAAGSGHFHHLAVARRLLHGVWIRKANVVWHVWAPVCWLRVGRKGHARAGPDAPSPAPGEPLPVDGREPIDHNAMLRQLIDVLSN